MKEEKDIIQSFIKLGCKCSNNGYHLYDIQKWLREVKSLEVIVKSWIEGKELVYLHSVNKIGIPSSYMNKDNHKTYEESLEAGIWEANFILNN